MADASIFDMTKLLENTCDDKELAAQVVGVFLTDIPVQFRDLEQALAGGDIKTAERVCHSIKGASATVGGEALREIAYTCERLGHDCDLDGLKERAAELRAQFDRLNETLRNEGFVEA